MESLLHAVGWLLMAVLSLAGVLVSLASFTGAWLIALAALVFVWMGAADVQGWWIAGLFLVFCVGLEIFDFFAGKWGVSRRGGSSAAGWAALGGGLLGMVLGAMIPLPVLGSFIGMLAGSFGAAYWVEKRRLMHGAKAAHIARGAVWARLMVMFVKTVAALGMTFYLWYVMLR
jgi:uncharacterized protein YqgC (DUF456 family)